MELLQLIYFCSAAENENFSKTAKEYSVPASNISQSIHRLEKELGVTLFDRSANKIKLNSRGRLFYEKTKSSLSLLNEAKVKVSSEDDISGEIRILVETNRRIVTKAVEKFITKYDSVSFFINNSVDENIDNYDIIITDRIITKKHFKSKLLITENILLAMKEENPLAKKENLSVSDLENERFITMNTLSGVWKVTNEICTKAGFSPNIVIQSDDPFYVRKYIEMGLGIAFIPSTSWKGMFSDDIIFKDIAGYMRNTYAYHNTQRYFSNAARSFLNALTRETV